MMIIKNYIEIILISCLFSTSSMSQQLPEQEDFLLNTFLQNPAMTAPFFSGHIGATHRTFWSGFADAPKSLAVFGAYPLEKMSIGGGLQRDEFGIWRQDIIQATYAYQLDLGRGRSPQLALGLGAGLINSTFNLTDIVSNSPIDPSIPIQVNTNQLAIFSAGIYFTTTDRDHEDYSHFAIGLGGKYVLPQRELFYTSSNNNRQNRVIHANAILSYRFINDYNYLFFEPSIWLDFTQHIELLSPVIQIQGGSSKSISGGIRYRLNGDFSCQLYYTIFEKLPLTAGISIIRPANKAKGVGLGYGFIINYTFQAF